MFEESRKTGCQKLYWKIIGSRKVLDRSTLTSSKTYQRLNPREILKLLIMIKIVGFIFLFLTLK